MNYKLKNGCPYCVENLRAIAKLVKKQSRKKQVFIVLEPDIEEPEFYHILTPQEKEQKDISLNTSIINKEITE